MQSKNDKTTKAKQRRIFNMHSVRNQIFMITMSFVTLFGVIGALISYQFTSRNLWETTIQSSEAKISLICSSISSNVINSRVFVQSCQTNKNITSYIASSENNQKQRNEVRDFVYNLSLSNSSLSTQLIRMIIISNNKEDIIQIVDSFNSVSGITPDKVRELDYFEMLHEAPGTTPVGIIPDSFYAAKNPAVIPVIYTIEHPYRDEETGFIFMELSPKIITQPLEDYTITEGSALVINLGNYSYQYANKSLVALETEYEVIEDLSSSALNPDTLVQMVVDKSSSHKYIAVTRKLDANTWTATEYIDFALLSSKIRSTYMLSLLLIIMGVGFLGMFLYLFLYLIVTDPVNKLVKRMDRIKEGDFTKDYATEWNNEFGQIGKTINDLSENVLTLMNQKISDEKEKKDYEYRMLQSQINPHFLYNTLNSIKWMATVQGDTGIAEMTTALSRLLKEISKGTTSLVTIEREFSLAKEYFTIQQYRYGGTISLDFTIADEELLQYPIVKFTLQPLIENSIFHGIEPKGAAGKMRIHLYQEGDNCVCIDVTDDGVGIPKEMIPTLLTQEDKQISSGSFFKEIGIGNVDKRLKYTFGNEYGLTIKSVPDSFTTVTVRLPLRKETIQ